MEILKYEIAISALCKQHKVERLFVYGSILTDKFHATSDVDLLVKFGAVDLYHYFDNFLGFKEGLELLLARPVDLLEEQTVKNPILLKSINRTKKLIYGRTDSEMAA